ncbi:MAG: hypothetical protein J6Q54_08220 [Oscillospiraceae bacterium]|nr:hypothetical protein [Oscillospiraceae bacterium]
MRKLIAVFLVVIMLTGCKVSDNTALNQFLEFRNKVGHASGCSVVVNVTADYGDAIYYFGMDCKYLSTGDMEFTITSPDTINGITGRIQNGKGQFIFDEQVVVFEPLADNQITPALAPWLIMKSLTGGYISSFETARGMHQGVIEDSFGGVTYTVDVWTDNEALPVRGEILWQGRRILSVDIIAFEIL